MLIDTDQSLIPPLSASARFSDCRRYRYTLERTWDPSKQPVCWVMLNPSTADAFRLDNTIRRCMAFAREWGHGGIRVVNLFAFRATKPAVMRAAADPVNGPDDERGGMVGDGLNLSWIVQQSDGCRLIAAWGCGGDHLGRAAQVMSVLRTRRVECLRLTKDGHPEHPLYVPNGTVPEPFARSDQTRPTDRSL